MKKVDEREVAADALIDIVNEEGFNNIVLRNTLKKYPEFTSVQKRFITELVNGTLRNIIFLDYIIDSISNTKTNKMKPFILMIIRLSVYQIKFMDKVPKSAICNSAVNIVKKRGFDGLSGFVNGVIRNVMRKENEIEYPSEDNKVEYLSIMFSYPQWIIKYWVNTYSYETVKNMCIENNKTPKVSACMNNLKCNKDELLKSFEEDQVIVKEDEDDRYKNLMYLSNTSNLVMLHAFQKGLFHVMDKSSVKAVNVLNPEKGDKILDLCSAPGGKSIYSAYKMENNGRIVSCDIYDHKLELVKDAVKRLGVSIIEPKVEDATVLNENFFNCFDKVILDAPCSCLGLIKKKPDIKYTKTFQDILELVKIQRKMLENASKYVKVGGKILYSTCTVSPKENIGNINWFLDNFDFQLDETHQLIPGENNVISDGFFIALLSRKE